MLNEKAAQGSFGTSNNSDTRSMDSLLNSNSNPVMESISNVCTIAPNEEIIHPSEKTSSLNFLTPSSSSNIENNDPHPILLSKNKQVNVK